MQIDRPAHSIELEVPEPEFATEDEFWANYWGIDGDN